MTLPLRICMIILTAAAGLGTGWGLKNMVEYFVLNEDLKSLESKVRELNKSTETTPSSPKK